MIFSERGAGRFVSLRSTSHRPSEREDKYSQVQMMHTRGEVVLPPDSPSEEEVERCTASRCVKSTYYYLMPPHQLLMRT